MLDIFRGIGVSLSVRELWAVVVHRGGQVDYYLENAIFM